MSASDAAVIAEPVSNAAESKPPQAETGLERRLRFLRTYGSWRRAVRELWRFKWRENRQKQMIGGYHTRGNGVPYFVRHTTRDIGVFSEISCSVSTSRRPRSSTS